MVALYDNAHIYDSSLLTYDGDTTDIVGSGQAPDIDKAGPETPGIDRIRIDTPGIARARIDAPEQSKAH